MTITHAEFERLSQVLQRLTLRPSTTSDEKHALRTAAQAMFFVAARHQTEFGDFAADIDVQLTHEQRVSLKKMGLEE